MTAESKSSSGRKVLGRVVLIVVIVLVVGFIAIQLIPVRRDNPPVVNELTWDSPETRALAQRACFDCHSNETGWPWYSYVAPVSWVVASDVHRGRAVYNLSEWDDERAAIIVELMAEAITEEEMPLPTYLIMHPEARLTQAERDQLIAGLRASVP